VRIIFNFYYIKVTATSPGTRSLQPALLGQQRLRINWRCTFPDFEVHFRRSILWVYQCCSQYMSPLYRLPALHGRVSKLRINGKIFTMLYDNCIRSGHICDLNNRAIENCLHLRIVIGSNGDTRIFDRYISADGVTSKTLGDNTLLHRPGQTSTIPGKVGGKFCCCRRIGKNFGVTFADRRLFRFHFSNRLSSTLSLDSERGLTCLLFQSPLLLNFPLDCCSDCSRQTLVFLLFHPELLLKLLFLLG